MGFAKEQNDVIFITVSLTPSLQRFFNTHVSGAYEVNTMLSLDCIDFVSSSVDSHVSTRKTQVSISKTHSNCYRVLGNDGDLFYVIGIFWELLPLKKCCIYILRLNKYLYL